MQVVDLAQWIADHRQSPEKTPAQRVAERSDAQARNIADGPWAPTGLPEEADPIAQRHRPD